MFQTILSVATSPNASALWTTLLMKNVYPECKSRFCTTFTLFGDSIVERALTLATSFIYGVSSGHWTAFHVVATVDPYSGFCGCVY